MQTSSGGIHVGYSKRYLCLWWCLRQRQPWAVEPCCPCPCPLPGHLNPPSHHRHHHQSSNQDPPSHPACTQYQVGSQVAELQRTYSQHATTSQYCNRTCSLYVLRHAASRQAHPQVNKLSAGMSGVLTLLNCPIWK